MMITIVKKKISLYNIRPRIKLKLSKILYLTKKYEKILLNFLGNKQYKFGTPNLINPARAKGASLRRYNF